MPPLVGTYTEWLVLCPWYVRIDDLVVPSCENVGATHYDNRRTAPVLPTTLRLNGTV